MQRIPTEREIEMMSNAELGAFLQGLEAEDIHHSALWVLDLLVKVAQRTLPCRTSSDAVARDCFDKNQEPVFLEVVQDKLTQAMAIVGACHLMVMRSMGAPTTVPDVENLKGLSLCELVEAHHLVAEENKRKMALEGPVQMSVVCDDRLVAAIYVALHYEPETTDDGVEGILATEAGTLCYIAKDVKVV